MFLVQRNREKINAIMSDDASNYNTHKPTYWELETMFYFGAKNIFNSVRIDDIPHSVLDRCVWIAITNEQFHMLDNIMISPYHWYACIICDIRGIEFFPPMDINDVPNITECKSVQRFVECLDNTIRSEYDNLQIVKDLIENGDLELLTVFDYYVGLDFDECLKCFAMSVDEFDIANWLDNQPHIEEKECCNSFLNKISNFFGNFGI